MGLLQICLLIGALQAFLLAIGLGLRYAQKQGNIYFVVILGLFGAALLSKFFYTPARYWAAPHWWYVADLLAYGFGLFLYCFIKRSYTGAINWERSDLLLLLPVAYYTCFLGLIFSMDTASLHAATHQAAFAWFFYSFVITVLWVNTGFLVKTYHLLQQHPTHKYAKPFYVGFYLYTSVLLIWITCFLLSFLSQQQYLLNYNYYDIAFMIMAICCLGLSLWGYVQPNLYQLLTYGYQPTELDHLKTVAHQIKIYLKEEQPYLNSNFSLHTIVEALNYNRSIVSKAINSVLGQSFSDLVNHYRVEHFLDLTATEDLEQFTLLAIAEKAGFGNKVSFYKAFKKNKGTTPKAYLDAQAKKRSLQS